MRLPPLTLSGLSVAALLALGQPLAAADTARAAQMLSTALQETRTGDWAGAAGAAQAAGPVARDLVEWLRLRAGRAEEFGAYTAFLGRHPDWPQSAAIRARGEAAIPNGADPDRVIAYFNGAAPQTGGGALALAAAWAAKGAGGKAESVITTAWKTLSLDEGDQVAFISGWGIVLSKSDAARLDNLLWRERITEAQRMLPLVSAERGALARARIALRRDDPGANAAVAAVPAKLSDDAGLAWERFAWRMRKGRYEEAAAFLDARSVSAAALGRPEVWAERRALLARREMREGDAKRAYRLASRHFLKEGSDYADLEWLAGYIALRKLNDPARAVVHFENMRLAVASPISLGRAGYWEGRAFEALGKAPDARAAYEFGAKYQTGFYGLLSAERLGRATDPVLAQGTGGDGRGGAFTGSDLYEAAMLLRAAGEKDLAKRFFTQLADTLDATGLAQLSDLALSLDEPNIALLVAKEAASRGIVLPRAYFPVMGLARLPMQVQPEFALAIARRESEFDPAVVSSAGARGLMQVMPGTAEQMARKIGVPYTAGKLTTDWRYNAQMGTAYLAHLEEEFGPSVALVAAGYNAGPGRSREWIASLGDPRSDRVDVVDWIEHIPFTETRNYVMRVAESIPVYRARLAGKPVPIRLTQDLK